MGKHSYWVIISERNLNCRSKRQFLRFYRWKANILGMIKAVFIYKQISPFYYYPTIVVVDGSRLTAASISSQLLSFQLRLSQRIDRFFKAFRSKNIIAAYKSVRARPNADFRSFIVYSAVDFYYAVVFLRVYYLSEF